MASKKHGRCRRGIRPCVGSSLDRRSWPTKTEARLALFTYIEGWYNPRRRHGPA